MNRYEIQTPMMHVFKYRTKKLVCEEELWVSDNKHDSHYRKNHQMNKGQARLNPFLMEPLTVL